MGDELSRKVCIENGLTCVGNFVVIENPKASGKEPWYEIASFSAVNTYSAIIDKVAAEKNVDARLIRSIMYLETTHGYYDAPLVMGDVNKSILPMNINTYYWRDTFGSREDLKDPEKNIRAGAELLSRIQSNLPANRSIEQIATLYNNLSAVRINDYGMRVRKFYDEQPWLKK
jgi:soluble lytic murein transglycosylase-like protein